MPHLAIEGAVPSTEELERLEADEIAVRVGWLPPGISDLEFLRPVLDRIVDFDSSATGDHSLVGEMDALRGLHLESPLSQPVSARRLTALRSLRFRHGAVRDLLSCSGLEHLDLRLRAQDRPPLIASPLVAYRCVAADRSVLAEAPDFRSARRSLSTMDFAFAGSTDLAGLERYEMLSTLILERTSLRGAAVLPRLGALRLLVLADLRGVDDIGALADVRAEEVRVIDLGSVSEQLYERFIGTPNWTFPPGLVERRRRRLVKAAPAARVSRVARL